jgi:hypothetical protein
MQASRRCGHHSCIQTPVSSNQGLRIYLQQPLAENNKVPVSQVGFDELCFPYNLSLLSSN